MRKVRITLPAALTNLGPGIGTLGLALGLHTVVEISERADHQLIVDAEGEGSGHYSIGLRHPVTLALSRMFQRLERAPLGIHIRINNEIPLNSGLGAETAFLVAGIIGASNLMGGVFTREQILEVAAQISGRPDAVVTTLRGALATAFLDGESLVYRTLPLASLKVIVVVPELDQQVRKARAAVPEKVALQDVTHNLSRVPLLVEGLRSGDLELVSKVLDDKLFSPLVMTRVPVYRYASEVARRAGAQGVTLSGDGPALVAFAASGHDQLAEAIVLAFQSADVKARSWVLPVDTQGVVISAVQSV